MKKLITICLIMAVFFVVNAQNGNNTELKPSTISEYSIPLSRNGLSVTSFLLTPRINISRFEKNATIILDIKREMGTALNLNPSFKYSYNYEGKQYGNETLGKDAFNNITTSDITYEVKVTYGSKSWGWTKVDGMTNQFGPVDKDAKASDVTVRVHVVGVVFNGTSEIENKIRTLLKEQQASKDAEALKKKEAEAKKIAEAKKLEEEAEVKKLADAEKDGTSNNSGEIKSERDEENDVRKSSSATVESSTDSSDSSSTLTSDSGSKAPEATIHNNIFMAEAARKSQEEKAYQDVVKGVFDLFTPSAEESERKGREYVQKMEYKATLDKSLEGKIEAAKNGDDQSYYDIYSAYQYSFPKDARYFRRLAYSTGNASVFKAEKKLERQSPNALLIGYQYGEISPFGLSFFQTTDNFGFFMLFRLSPKAFTTYSAVDLSKNRDVYTTGNGTTYTFMNEATKEEQGKFMLSLGTSYNIYKPLFIYAGVGFGLVNTFSYQRKVEYNNSEVLKVDESYYGATTDVGLLIKLGRRFAINGGVSFMNLKTPEYTGGISFNFWPEK